MKVRLQSLKGEPKEGFVPMGIHAPGLIRWAKSGYDGRTRDQEGRKRDQTMVKLIAEAFGLKREVALAILTGEIEVTDDGDDVVFDWPGGDPLDDKKGDT